MILGTAGHIDHGKSRLLEALTGQPLDRLKEERARGITIDLNFAHLDLPDGRRLGVVDVPGHEDFVRTMVAGAAGLDAVLLVVAADEGIMPQTREHRAIVEQLAVPAGLAVLTKADLVEPEWLALVRDEVATWLSSSPIPFGPPIAVSAATGAGLEGLRTALTALIEHSAARRSAEDLFRLPVDRVFSVAGAGTVVTGTTVSGTLALGDQVLALPSGGTGRVRSLEVHGRAEQAVGPGVRTAIGLAGVDRAAIARGATIVHQAAGWTSTTVLDTVIRLLPDAARPLTGRTRVRLHLGTAEVMARAYPRGPLRPGDEGPARLVAEAPLIARGGDRLVVRSYSPVTTIGGGWVVDPAPSRRRGAWPGALTSTVPSERLGALVTRRRKAGLALDQVPLALGCSPGEVAAAARDAGCPLVAGRLYSPAELSAAASSAVSQVAEFHRRQPAQAGVPLETVRQSSGLAAQVVDALVADLVASGRLRVEQGMVTLPGFTPQVSGGEAAIDRVVEALVGAGLSPPNTAALAQELGRSDLRDILRLAEASGRLVAVSRDRYYAPEALDRFRAAVLDIGAGGEVSVAALRDRLGLSRKFLIPLLEWSDRAGITRRQGEIRRLT